MAEYWTLCMDKTILKGQIAKNVTTQPKRTALMALCLAGEKKRKEKIYKGVWVTQWLFVRYSHEIRFSINVTHEAMERTTVFGTFAWSLFFLYNTFFRSLITCTFFQLSLVNLTRKRFLQSTKKCHTHDLIKFSQKYKNIQHDN